jgi:hypothetical protein
MARSDQSDLFAAEAPEPIRRRRAETGVSRRRGRGAELYKIWPEARAAKTLPEPKQASLYKTIVPQMTNWLPETRPVNFA